MRFIDFDLEIFLIVLVQDFLDWSSMKSLYMHV